MATAGDRVQQRRSSFQQHHRGVERPPAAYLHRRAAVHERKPRDHDRPHVQQRW